ncbi:MAG: Immune inhibitor peptidase [Frankiales bacterium]|nr:Immune inhibitor peptidase [Frankiales bacterium]
MYAFRRLRAVAIAAALVTASATALAGQSAGALQQAPGAHVPTPLPSAGVVGGLSVENSFVSHVGWVKPGEAYPSRFLVRNTRSAVTSFSVSLPETRGMHWNRASSAVGSVTLAHGLVSWKVSNLESGARAVLILEAQAETTAQEPTVVWRNISSRGTLTTGASQGVFASHGPKVIPPAGGYDTARYGDRPFPVVPVDYADFQHTRSSAKLDSTINGKSNPASTFNLYQEISYGQLFPHATIPSVALKNKTYSPDPQPLKFSTLGPTTTNTCTGATLVDPTNGEPLPTYTQRIKDGWYQLPGQRSYYGSDANGSAIVGSVAGVGALQNIDAGCGPTAKLAYDAAVVADPDIDYSDYDTDKDGVVDFFEVVFEGCGGNGESQLSADLTGTCQGAAYDNVWPHSSSLEGSYVDPKTGLSGYITHDQLKDLEGHPLWYTDNSYTKNTTKDMGKDLIEYVRVGPYNVNPETAIQYASVISHEYGHSLGLPDYYSTGSRGTYGSFMLMATDHSQNMDIIGKKELGWVVPDVLPKGVTKVKNWHDTKRDTGAIHWMTKDGKPYTLSAANGDAGIHNGQAYQVALPGRQLLDPKLITANGGKQVWYSGSGNDFGCPTTGGHNLDFVIPGLDKVAKGTKVTASFKSLWEIEWDFDYGFVLKGVPDSKGKVSYTSAPSDNGYTTPMATNSNQNACQAKYGNGLTGTSHSAKAGTAAIDRVAGTYATPEFVDDSYDISSLAGVKGASLRFSYATDPGLAKLGWIIDDLKVTAGGKVLYNSDFENGKGGPNSPETYPGGCKEDLSVSGGVCTQGWDYLTAGTPSAQEHAYLMEMRDRSGFDFDGRGQDDRGGLSFQPGVLLTYTDEAHGYGNVGTDDPPAQSPLDANPAKNDEDPNLDDATFNATRKSYSDSKKTPHYDNYTEPSTGASKATSATEPWTFAYDCLKLDVNKMSGDTSNSAAAYDLVGDVTFTTAGGCAKFNYGFAAQSAVAPAVGGPGLPANAPPVAAPTAAGANGLPATGGLGAPVLAFLVLLLAGLLVRRRAHA